MTAAGDTANATPLREVVSVKNLLAFVLALGAILAGAAFLIFSTQDRAELADMKAEVAALRLETARQVALLVHSPDDKVGYDRQQAFRKHKEAVDALRKKYPALLKEDAFINEMEQRAKAGEKDQAKTKDYRARYDYVKEMYKQYIEAGNYKAIFSSESNGLRYDVVSIKKFTEGSTDGLRWDVIIYGAPVRDQLQLTNINLVNWLEFPELETSGKRKGQPKRTAFKMDIAPAMPTIWVDKPWEWMPEWPANVTVGYYVGLPAWDSRTKSVDITLTGQMRTLGGTTIPLEAVWNKVPVDSAWKGPAGGKWDDAQIQPLSDEDLKEQGIALPEDEAKPSDKPKQ